MQFLVVAYDGSDADAIDRRLRFREAHMANMTGLREHGHFIAGGAILDDDGEMIGSTLYLQFTNKRNLQNWLDDDPYMTGNVWQTITVHPIQLAEIQTPD